MRKEGKNSEGRGEKGEGKARILRVKTLFIASESLKKENSDSGEPRQKAKRDEKGKGKENEAVCIRRLRTCSAGGFIGEHEMKRDNTEKICMC